MADFASYGDDSAVLSLQLLFLLLCCRQEARDSIRLQVVHFVFDLVQTWMFIYPVSIFDVFLGLSIAPLFRWQSAGSIFEMEVVRVSGLAGAVASTCACGPRDVALEYFACELCKKNCSDFC